MLSQDPLGIFSRLGWWYGEPWRDSWGSPFSAGFMLTGIGFPWTGIGGQPGGRSQPIGLFFGRFANFINGELYGRITDVPWAIQFPAELFDHPKRGRSGASANDSYRPKSE